MIEPTMQIVPKAKRRPSAGPESPASAKPDVLLTLQEFAAMLKIGTTKALALIRDRAVPHMRIGRLIRVRQRDAQAYIDKSVR